jgi:hypothetical protein
LFVATERDNGNGSTSLPKILRFDASSTAASLNATAEWNLTSDLPSLPANAGPEGISWIPDTFLVAYGFRDVHTGAAYNPAGYPGHGSGLFFVGLENDGTVYAYALSQSGGGYTRVAAVASELRLRESTTGGPPGGSSHRGDRAPPRSMVRAPGFGSPARDEAGHRRGGR